MKISARLRDYLHLLVSLYGLIRYRHTFKRLCIIGVTGTDGKSSTVMYTARLLRKGGVKTAHYSSVTISDGDAETVNSKKMTTPGRAGLYKFLSEARQNDCTHAVIEVTSEGIQQWRVFGISFDILVYTNITPEHIERHGSFERYRDTKLSLLRQLRAKTHWTSTGRGMVFWSAQEKELAKTLGTCPKYFPVNPEKVISDSPFVALNYSLSLAVAKACGVEAVLESEELQIPGRFEFFRGSPSVVVDYAHTPNALEMCLSAARQITAAKIIHVFGAAGGGRDTWKRPILARISEKYTDIHILTEENSFEEDTGSILADIKKGFSSLDPVYIVPDRRQAIRLAFELANPGDLIVTTAKGSETVIAGKNHIHHPYNEREFVKQCQKSTIQ